MGCSLTLNMFLMIKSILELYLFFDNSEALCYVHAESFKPEMDELLNGNQG